MASSRNFPNELKITAFTFVMLILSLTFLPSKSVGSVFLRDGEGLKQMKLGLGSRPPRCINSCLGCRPCMAALVIPPHQKSGFRASTEEEDESYYLLSWKCRCGDKFFHP